jgi:hypothetical protein
MAASNERQSVACRLTLESLLLSYHYAKNPGRLQALRVEKGW